MPVAPPSAADGTPAAGSAISPLVSPSLSEDEAVEEEELVAVQPEPLAPLIAADDTHAVAFDSTHMDDIKRATHSWRSAPRCALGHPPAFG